jgi:succinoglycan biosynthesis transport protein ExoP
MEWSTAAEGSSLGAYLRVLRRRKWIFLQAIVLIPAAAVALSLHQGAKYRASSQVLLSRQNLPASLNGVSDPTFSVEPNRLPQTQADVARLPVIAGRTVSALQLHDRTAAALLAESAVSPSSTADLLSFSVTDRDPRLAQRLATEYARQYIAFSEQVTTGAIDRARRDVGARLTQLKLAGDSHAALYESLVEKEQQLATMATLQAGNATLVQAAGRGVQVEPRPVRNGILGLALGVLFGLGLVFLREALDTRVRSALEVAAKLGIPLLGRVPAPPRSIRGNNKLVMIEEPATSKSEPFRVLRTSLDFVNLDSRAKSIMITSALSGEGKSTTAANLAVALAHAGKSVILVDLDLRRPFIDRFFELNGHAGLTEVALGTTHLDAALAPVLIGSHGPTRWKSLNGPVKLGRLDVLKAGILPPNPGEFASSSAIAEILAELRDRADVVVVDAPPIVGLGDALALSARVDALLLVTRLKLLRRSTLNELRRVLDAAPVPALGFILTEADADEGYDYAYRYAYYERDGNGAKQEFDRALL